jgi:hypothetical protein
MWRVGQPGYEGPSLAELQLRLVDKVEAFHQHVYATLAVLALVLNHLRTGSDQSYPIGSISAFLQALKERKFRYQAQHLDRVVVLERSIDFRSKYVDHPEKHQLHDWMTYGYRGKSHIIFFMPKGAEVAWLGPEGDTVNLDPFSPRFRPPVNCGDDFYVAPDVDIVFEAVQTIVAAALGTRPIGA